MHQPEDHDIIYIIGRDKNDITKVLECEAVDIKGQTVYHCTDGQICPVHPDVIQREFKTRAEAQKELDDLNNYLNMRMGGHGKK